MSIATSVRTTELGQSHNRRGATAVEVAVVLPILLLLFFGAVELSQVNSLRHAAQAAAYESARRAIIPGATANDANNTATGLLDALAIRGASVQVEPEKIQPDTKQVTVTVKVPFSRNSLVASRFLRRDVLAGSCTLQREVAE